MTVPEPGTKQARPQPGPELVRVADPEHVLDIMGQQMRQFWAARAPGGVAEQGA